MTTEAALKRARCWLRRQRLEVEPSPLVVSRLEARRRASMAEAGTILACAIGMVAWMFLTVNDDDDQAIDPVWSLGFVLTLIVGMRVGFWWQRRLERPLLAGRTTRAAHPAAAGVVRVLGRGHLRVALAIYGGGVLLGAVLTVFAPPGAARTLALVFLAGVTALGVLATLALVDTLRRPSLADDAESLLVDDALRTEDARRATLPYPSMVAIFVGLDPTLGSPVILTLLLTYAAAGAVCWYLAERAARCAPKVAPATP